jgi:hypothetical protein
MHGSFRVTPPAGCCDINERQRPMILEFISDLFRRDLVPIRADELEILDRDGPRALNYGMSRSLKRTRMRFFSILRTLLFLVWCGYMWRWSGVGMLAFVVYGAALTVLVDILRQFLAARWLFYSHSRANRAVEVIIVGSTVEGGRSMRPARPPRPPLLVTLTISSACTLIGLPLVWFTLNQLGLATWDTVFANFFMPLCMLVIGVWRVARGLLAIQFVKGSTVGSRDLLLDSDDALDIYALALVLGLLLAPLGATALAAFLVVLVRLAFVAYLWQRQRQALALLQKRIYRQHPHAPGSKSHWNDDEAAPELDH